MTEQWTAADLAFRRWCSHAITCRVCRTDDTRCARGRRLGETWRQARRTTRTRSLT